MPGFTSLDYADAELYDGILNKPKTAIPINLPLDLKAKPQGGTPIVSPGEQALMREEESAMREYFRQQKAKQAAIEEEIFKNEQMRRDEIRRRVSPAELQEPTVSSRNYESEYRPSSIDNPSKPTSANKPLSPASPPVDVATQSGARPTALLDPTVPPSSAIPKTAVSGPPPQATARPPGLPQAIGRIPAPVIGVVTDFGFRLVAGQPVQQAATGAVATTAGTYIGGALGASVAGPVGLFIGGIIGGFVAGAISDANFRNSIPATAEKLAGADVLELPFNSPYIRGAKLDVYAGGNITSPFNPEPFDFYHSLNVYGPVLGVRLKNSKVEILAGNRTFGDWDPNYLGWQEVTDLSGVKINSWKIYKIERRDNNNLPLTVPPQIAPIDARNPTSIAHPGNLAYPPVSATLEAKPKPTDYAPGGLPSGGTARGDAPNWIPHAGLAPRQNPNPTTTPSNLGGNLPEITPTPINTPSPKENSPLINKPPQNAEVPSLGGGFIENADPHTYKIYGPSYTPTGSSTGSEKPTPSGLPQSKKSEVPEDGFKLLPVIPPLVIPNATPQTPTDPLSTPNQPPSVPPGGSTGNPCEGNACASSIRDAVKGNSNKLDGLNAALNGLDLAGLGEVLKRLDKIDEKLGPQIPNGGISNFLQGFLERFNKVANWLHLDRVLNVLIWWQTLHNAYMLSNNLGQTLTSAFSNVLAALGFKDAEGNPFDITAIIGTTFDNFAKSALGEKEWGSIKAEWKRFNRIYQAGANILNSVQSIGHSVLGGLNVVGSWNAQIGNALRKWGAVGERAYNWMNPQVNFQNRFFTALETVENVVSQIDQIASEVLSAQENVKQIGEQSKELFDSLGQNDNSKQSKEVPEAQKIKAQAEASKVVSKGQDLSETDKEADE
jgi:hypothetical protein